jgi:iron complex transport system substrate-binding protein
MVLVLFCTAAVFAGGRQEADTRQEAAAEEQAAAEKGAAPSTPETVTVTDFLGREVTITRPVESVAFTHYATAEALKILDAWSLVVARDGYTGDTVTYPNLEEIPALSSLMGSGYEPNMELLYELDPDLLILEVIPMPGMRELIDALEGTIPVVALKTYDPVHGADSLEALGRLLGREREASAYVNWSLDTQNALLEKTASLKDDKKTRMFYKTGWGTVEELMTFSNDMSYIPTRNRVTGCINIAADLPSQGGWVPSIDPEWLAGQDFDVFIIGDPQPTGYGLMVEDTSGLAAHRAKVMALPVFAETSAVKNDRVYMLADVFFGTPRYIIGFAYLAKWFHPDLFEDLDPRALHQEYFTRFLDTDVDLMSTGVFVYPEE